MPVLDRFSLAGKIALVTGGEGLLGKMIIETIEELGGRAYSLDIKPTADIVCDITNKFSIDKALAGLPTVDILVNNAIGNQRAVPSVWTGWQFDLNIGLTGTLLMTSALESRLWNARGVVLNIGSDLGLIGPDPSLYPDGMMKPASYSAVKHGMIGLTRYFASMWGERVRCNCLCPGGIDQGQTVPNVPMKRLATLEEMSGPVAFMLSDASSYMNGAVVVVDGGRTAI